MYIFLIHEDVFQKCQKYIYISEWGASKIMIYDNKFNYYGWLGTYDEITDKIKSDYWTKNANAHLNLRDSLHLK